MAAGGSFDPGPVGLPEGCALTRWALREAVTGVPCVATELARTRAALGRARRWSNRVNAELAGGGDVDRHKALAREKQVVSGLMARLQVWEDALIEFGV